MNIKYFLLLFTVFTYFISVCLVLDLSASEYVEIRDSFTKPLWASKIPDSVCLDFDKAELNRNYKIIIIDKNNEKRLADELYSAERSLSLSISREISTSIIYGLVAQISIMAKTGYLPAIGLPAFKPHIFRHV